jgi:hypothetical protein
MGRKKNGKMEKEKGWSGEMGGIDEGFEMGEKQTACFYNVNNFF